MHGNQTQLIQTLEVMPPIPEIVFIIIKTCVSGY